MPQKYTYRLEEQDNIFFTADHHFGHGNIVKYENRPFQDAKEMNDILIEHWNSTVHKNSIVFVLGDFCWNPNEISNIQRKLNGRKFFLKGNHDKGVFAQNWPDIIEISIGNKFIVCSHYPMLSWNRSFHGSYHLFGHVHSKYITQPNLRSYNVGVDVNQYSPVSFKEIDEYLVNKPTNKM